MEFIRETIAHRSTSSNIGSDEIHVQCIDIKEEAVDLEEDFINVKENSETKDTQELPQNLTDINPMPKSPKKACITQPRSRGSRSPIKRSRGSIDKQIDLELLKMLKEEKKSSNDSTSAQPDDELTSYGKYIAATLRGMDKFHQELAKLKLGQVLFEVQYSPAGGND